MIKTEKVPILDIFSSKTILMFMVGSKKLGKVGNRNHTYISFKPNQGGINKMLVRMANREDPDQTAS